MKKSVLVGAVVIILVLLLSLALARHSQQPASHFVIGGILPLTGDLADLGSEINRGAIIATDEAKAHGIDVSYIGEDDAFVPEKEASAAHKLLQVDGAQAVFVAAGEESKTVSPIFEQAKVPVLVAWDSNEELKKAGKYTFSIGFSTEGNAALLADYSYDTLGLRKMMIVQAIDPVGDILAASFKQEFQKKGGTIIDHEQIQADQQQHQTLIAKINAQKPDGLYLILIPPQYSTFLPQLRRTSFSGQIVAADSLVPSEITVAGAAANGMYYTNVYALHPDEIAQKYKERFGEAPHDPNLVSFGYDSVETLLKGHEIARQKNIPLRDALTMVHFGGLGTTVNMNGTQFSERVEKIFKVMNGVSTPAN